MTSAVTAPLPESISTVIFDVGNTLHHLDHAFIADVICSTGHSVGALDVAMAEYQAKAAVDRLFRARSAGPDEARHVPYFETMLTALGVSSDSYEEIVDSLRAENDRRSLWRVMHPRTPHVLDELRRRGFTLAVISNADGRVPAALAASGIAGHFTVVIDSHLVGVEKPDPRIFMLALEACDAAAQDAVYVGDIYEIDVRGARSAGLAAVLLDPLGLYGEVDCPRVTALDHLLDLLPPRGSSEK
jgi:HAD superfamily hydrolase (TIGR01549 family)